MSTFDKILEALGYYLGIIAEFAFGPVFEFVVIILAVLVFGSIAVGVVMYLYRAFLHFYYILTLPFRNSPLNQELRELRNYYCDSNREERDVKLKKLCLEKPLKSRDGTVEDIINDAIYRLKWASVCSGNQFIWEERGRYCQTEITVKTYVSQDYCDFDGQMKEIGRGQRTIENYVLAQKRLRDLGLRSQLVEIWEAYTTMKVYSFYVYA